MTNIQTSKTDERFIADIFVPGVPEEAISVLVRPDTWEGNSGDLRGHDFTVKVRADRLPDNFGGNKYVTMKLTQVFDVDVEFDLKRLHWTYKDGIIRVSVPKQPFAIGAAVAKSVEAWVEPTKE
jgi:HSP20 family molecular chaperone IbpA